MIENSKAIEEDRMEVAWKFGDIYEKILVKCGEDMV